MEGKKDILVFVLANLLARQREVVVHQLLMRWGETDQHHVKSYSSRALTLI